MGTAKMSAGGGAAPAREHGAALTGPSAAESFGMVTVRDAAAPSQLPQGAAAAQPQGSLQQGSLQQAPDFRWPDEVMMPQAPQCALPEELRPAPGEQMRMAGVRRVLEAVGLLAEGDGGRLEPDMLLALTRRLSAMGMECAPAAGCPFRVREGDMLALFPKPQEPMAPLTYRSVMLTVVYLAVWLIQNDEQVSAADLRLIDDWIEAQAPRGRSTLSHRGLVRWLLSRRRILSRRVKTRAASQMGRFVHKRAAALTLLLDLVAAAPHSHRRLKNLEALFPLFGLEPSRVHSELHRHATEGRSLPSAPAASAAATGLDRSRLAALERSTQQSRLLLQEIFSDEGGNEDDNLDDKGCGADGSLPDAADAAGSVPSAALKSKEALEALYNKVKERPRWSRAEFDALAARLGLSPAAALEELNDYAYDHTDAPLLEEDGDSLLVEGV